MVSIVQSALFAAFFIVLLSSVLITSLFRLRTVIPYILSIYLLTFANILITVELAGLFSLLNNRFFFLLIHIFILLVSIIIWKKKGSPELFAPIKLAWKDFKTVNIFTRLKNHPILFILGLGVSAAYFMSAILVLEFPPNNYDSMTCHMTRVGYWLQHGNFLPWSTYFRLEVEYPINAQIQVLWSVLFWRTDKFAGFTQWFAAIMAILAIYGIARLMRFSRSQALFASFIYSLFPQILLQSSTTMPHLLGATLVTIAFYFLFLGFHEHSKLLLIISGLAIGMACGVHIIVLFTLPGYSGTLLYLCIRNKRIFSRSFQWIMVSSVLSFIIFSSYIYIQNEVFFKNPFGTSGFSNPWTPDKSFQDKELGGYWNPNNVLKYTYFNTSRYVFASYDLTGIPNDIAKSFYKIRDAVFIPLFEKTNNPKQAGEFDINAKFNFVSENSAWFGLVGFFLFFPLITLATLGVIKNKEPIRGILVCNIILYSLIWSTLIARESNWSVYSGRYFVPAALLFAPLIALVYKRGVWLKLFCALLVLSSFYIGYGTIKNNYTKPLDDKLQILKWGRLQKISSVGWDQYPIFAAVENNVPKRSTLGLAITGTLMEYPYFGEYFQRTLIPIYPYELMGDSKWLIEKKIDWILSCVGTDNPDGFVEVTKIDLDPPIGISSQCSLYHRR